MQLKRLALQPPAWPLTLGFFSVSPQSSHWNHTIVQPRALLVSHRWWRAVEVKAPPSNRILQVPVALSAAAAAEVPIAQNFNDTAVFAAHVPVHNLN